MIKSLNHMQHVDKAYSECFCQSEPRVFLLVHMTPCGTKQHLCVCVLMPPQWCSSVINGNITILEKEEENYESMIQSLNVISVGLPIKLV